MLACTASLNVAVAVVDTATFVAPLAGVSLVTLGAAGSVVNDHENGRAHGIAGAILGTADRGGVGRVVGQGRAGGQGDCVVRAVVADGCRAPDCHRAGSSVKLIVLGLHGLVECRGGRRRHGHVCGPAGRSLTRDLGRGGVGGERPRERAAHGIAGACPWPR